MSRFMKFLIFFFFSKHVLDRQTKTLTNIFQSEYLPEMMTDLSRLAHWSVGGTGKQQGYSGTEEQASGEWRCPSILAYDICLPGFHICPCPFKGLVWDAGGLILTNKLFNSYYVELFLQRKHFFSPSPWKVITIVASWSRILELRKGQQVVPLVNLFDLQWIFQPAQSSDLESSSFKGPMVFLWPSWQLHQWFKGSKRTNLWYRKEICCYHTVIAVWALSGNIFNLILLKVIWASKSVLVYIF